MKKVLCILFALSVLCSQALAVSCGGSPLEAGEYIGIISPSSCMDREEIDSGDLILRSHDIITKLGASVYEVYGYLAGTDQQRADDINAMFRDDSVKAIICTRGGYGAARILDKLDYDMISRHPKPIIGYSDVTALLCVLNERCGIPTVHGPMLVSLTRDSTNTEYTRTNFLAGLNGEVISGEIPMPEGRTLQTMIPGHAEGAVIGGNLTLIASLVGTPYELKAEGALLLLEEVGEKPYRIDRMMNQLWQNGLLQRVNGILLGDFINCENTDASPDSRTFGLEDVLRYYAELCGKPVIRGIPAGHGEDNMYLPFGVHAVMNANENGTASVILGR
ncbi:MAG: LD-carboxypeptidase [Synergistaceae bacterium]|nr:LD-carboxypeptidase [Synergistaceae bacterium]